MRAAVAGAAALSSSVSLGGFLGGGGGFPGGGCGFLGGGGGCFGCCSGGQTSGGGGTGAGGDAPRIATVENPLRKAAATGGGGGAAPRLPVPPAPDGDAELGGAGGLQPQHRPPRALFPEADETRAAYDARSRVEVASFLREHGAAIHPDAPASLPPPSAAPAAGAGAAYAEGTEEGLHGSDRAAFDDVEGVRRTHVDETW